jgi:hypothetical protein
MLAIGAMQIALALRLRKVYHRLDAGLPAHAALT